jgi:hypothetical protein
MQKFVPAHSTLLNSLAEDPDGGATVSRDHFVPFHRWTISVFTPPVMEYPAAAQPFAPEGQEIPVRTVELAPATFAAS